LCHPDSSHAAPVVRVTVKVNGFTLKIQCSMMAHSPANPTTARPRPASINPAVCNKHSDTTSDYHTAG